MNFAAFEATAATSFHRHEVVSDDAVVARSIFGIFFPRTIPRPLGAKAPSAPKGDNVDNEGRSLAHELFCLVRRRREEKRPFTGPMLKISSHTLHGVYTIRMHFMVKIPSSDCRVKFMAVL